jgi:hypothetical protein
MASHVNCQFRICALVAVSCLAPHGASGAPAIPGAQQVEESPLQRGQQVARAVATVTGTAISPILGVCILGAYSFWKTPSPERAALPFYCSPYFWIPLALLAILVLLKDTIGAAAPLLKKPLDAIEILIVNKAAFLFAVLPVVWHEAAAITPAIPPITLLPHWEAQAVQASSAGALLATGATPVILAAVAFTVWLTGHALDVLALLSPIPWLDAVFKACRALLLLIVGTLAALSPRSAMLLSLLIIAVSLLCFWWALRLAVFGAVFAWDILRSHLLGQRRDPSPDREVLAFTAHAIGGLRKRSFGALRRARDGTLEFAHRPVGIGFRSAIRLQDPERYEVSRGLFFPCLLVRGKSGRDYRFQFRLLPRYTGYEREICDVLGLGGVRDLRVPSEVRGAWNWLRGSVANVKAA